MSAEAINSSLYYLHAASPDDYALLQESQLEREDEEERLREEGLLDESTENDMSSGLKGQLNNFRRKPVPPATDDSSLSPSQNVDTTSSTTSPDMPVDPNSTTEDSNLNVVQASSLAPSHSLPEEPINQDVVQKRPVPPTPAEVRSNETPGANTTTENLNEAYKALQGNRGSSDSRPSLSRPPTSDGVPLSSVRSSQREPGDWRNSSELHITLVRRDPSHGSQWNVATMTSSNADNSAFDIEVTTPGYSKFASSRNDPVGSLAGLPPHIRDAASSLASAQADLNAEQPVNKDRFKPGTFHRELRISRAQQPQQFQSHRHSSSVQDTLSRLDTSVGHAATNAARAARHKSGYYSFKSPWDGTCTFLTSLNGQSLKCKHIIPGPGSSVNAPPETQPPAITVAELRFNLPLQMATSAMAKVSTSLREGGEAGGGTTTTARPTSSLTHSLSKRKALGSLLNPNIHSSRQRHHSRNSSNLSYRPPASSPYRLSSSSGGDDSDDTKFNTNGNNNVNDINSNNSMNKPPPPPLPSRSTDNNSNNNMGKPPPPPLPNRSMADNNSRRSLGDSGDESESRMDFSLAHENAGGGIKGDEAKLGKLIVEDEGIKMLDLVVAASMAVFWSDRRSHSALPV